jgi:hypothetical protein
MPVYVIQAGDGGPYKIGHTRNVAARLEILQTVTITQTEKKPGAAACSWGVAQARRIARLRADGR